MKVNIIAYFCYLILIFLIYHFCLYFLAFHL